MAISTLERSPRRDRRLALALVLCIAALLARYYWLGLRPIPQDWGCYDSEPAGNDTEAFRAGLPIIHAACALALLAMLVWLSHRRNGGHPGTPTSIAAGLCAAVAVAAIALPDEVGGPLLVGAFYASLLSVGALPVGGALCLLAGALWRGKAAPWLTAAGLWIAATVIVPGHAVAVYLKGEGPIVC
jgi:hypothetical protein